MNIQLKNLLDFINKLDKLCNTQENINKPDLQNSLLQTETNIKELLCLISQKHSLSEATECFQILDKYQFLLAKIIFKNQIDTNVFLREFVRDYDRLDDKELRSQIFLKMKNTSSHE